MSPLKGRARQSDRCFGLAGFGAGTGTGKRIEDEDEDEAEGEGDTKIVSSMDLIVLLLPL